MSKSLVRRALLATIFFSTVLQAKVPDTVSLDFVLSEALKKAQAFKALRAQQMLSESTEAQSEAQFAWNIEAAYERVDNRNESPSPLSPSPVKSSGPSVGVSKYLVTGTGVSANIKQTENEIGFPAGSGINIPGYKETVATVGISQNLWRDAFGQATRAQYGAMKAQAHAQGARYLESKENYSLALISQYYGAWLAQQKLRSTLESHKRRQELLKSTKIRLDRGIAERTDLLQTEAAILFSENNLKQVQSELDQKWRELVTILGLPDEYLMYPAIEIPLEMRPQVQSWTQFCQKPDHETVMQQNQALVRAFSEFKAAELQKDAAASMQKSELQLRAQLSSNGVDENRFESQNEAFGNRHPSWFVGLYWKKSLGTNADHARALQAHAQLVQTETQFSNEKDNYKIAYLQVCKDFQEANTSLKRAVDASQKQQERYKLEEQRFRLGRSTTFQVIQAGDDATQAQLIEQQLKVGRELLHWRLVQLSGQMMAQIERWEK